MIVTSTFKVDLFQLKHTKDQEGLLQAMKDANAAALGRKLIEKFPYEKIAAFEGTLPEMSLNKDHEFTDTYERVLVVFGVKEIRQKIRQLESEAEELIQEHDDVEEANIRLGSAQVLKQLLQ